MTKDPRFTRQARLAEVGDEGQARLSRAHVHVEGAGARAAVEERYLEGAGVTVDGVTPAEHPSSDPAWLAALHPAAREVASGAYAALDVIRAVLAERPHPRVAPR